MSRDTLTFTPRLGDRSLFPDLATSAYFNHAAISPPSTAVRHAVTSALADYAQRGAAAFPTWAASRLELKCALARLLHVSAEDLAFTPNTSHGVLDIALCFPWNRGDRVVLFEGEFPANTTPWQRAAELFGLEIVWIPVERFLESNEAGLARLRGELERGVRLVAVSAVQFQSGLRMPLEAMATLCHEAGAQLFVDAVQAMGIVPIDAKSAGIDYLASGSHKWLMGVEGAGFLYVSPARVGELRPNIAGWLSHHDPVGFLLRGEGLLKYDRPIRKRADFFEGGGVSTLGFAALAASVDLLEDLGIEAIYTHVNAILNRLEPELTARGFTSLRAKDPAQRSGTLSVRPPEGLLAVDLQRELFSRGITISMPDGLLRFSPHWPNESSQVDDILRALDESLKALGR